MDQLETPKYKLVMLIDDSEIDNLVNRHILTRNNVSETIVTHTSALSALNFFNATKYSESDIPDLILLDINMPIMTGFEFLIQFEKLATSIKDKSKIIMLSSSVDPNDIKHSQESKYISGFISKPLSIEQLLKF